jgi:hypothetical protein
MAWTIDRNPKRSGESLKEKVMLFRATLHISNDSRDN